MPQPELSPFLLRDAVAFGKPVCRLGLATRGESALTADDVLHAVDRGINFLNWPGEADSPGGPDAISDAIGVLGPARDQVVLCVQFGSRSAADASQELQSLLSILKTDYIDIVTFYYVEHAAEWQELIAPGGALSFCAAARRDGVIRRLGVTSHQRSLAAEMARSGLLDGVMVRYNAAHRGAERDLFPVTTGLQMPVISYTALRWGALVRPTPDDPPGFVVPRAPAWYRFALHHPAVTVALAAPHNRAELDEDLTVLGEGPLSAADFVTLSAHGERVHRHAGRFP